MSTTMTREEHLEWARNRAREYLTRGDALNAVTSMLSDLSKHEGTAKQGLSTFLVVYACSSISAARDFIEGFH